MERGVVFTPVEIIEKDEGFITGNEITPEELNYLVLYWDRLAAATTSHVHPRLEIEEELTKCGILTRPNFRFEGVLESKLIPALMATTHAKTIDLLRKKDGSVDWRMHFLNEQAPIPDKLAVKKEVVRFELLQLLPVPQRGVPLHEILEFKSRRNSELQALHGYLDELYLEVMGSSDFDLRKAKALSGLKKSLKDLDELNKQGWRSPIKFNISSTFEFSLKDMIAGGYTAYEMMHSEQPFQTFFTGAALTVLSGFINIRPQFQRVLKNGDPKLAYLTNAKKENILEFIQPL